MCLRWLSQHRPNDFFLFFGKNMSLNSKCHITKTPPWPKYDRLPNIVPQVYVTKPSFSPWEPIKPRAIDKLEPPLWTPLQVFFYWLLHTADQSCSLGQWQNSLQVFLRWGSVSTNLDQWTDIDTAGMCCTAVCKCLLWL